MTTSKIFCGILIFTIWLNLLSPFVQGQRRYAKYAPRLNDESQEKGLQFRLREGVKEKEKPPIINQPVAAANLSESETNAILRRLPPMPSQPPEKSDFTRRADSLPPPKTGNIIPIEFPSTSTPRAPKPSNNDSKNLEIVRFAPSGEIALAADLSVTFSQPMIAVATQEETSQNVPVKLTPNVPGKWRWLGTTTLIFDADRWLPMATKFVATIPAGTKSAVGGILSKDVSWTFSTPPPKVELFYPIKESVRRDALILTGFNQEINPEAVLQKTVAAVAKSNQKIPLRLATKSEIEADKEISEKIRNLPPKSFIVFRAIDILPPDADINVTFETGAPSAEGSLTSGGPQGYTFKTYGALKFVKSRCGYDESQKECELFDEWVISLSNSIDEEEFDSAQIKIEPTIEDVKVSIYDDEIHISGSKKPRTIYKVTVASSLKDYFGQTLGNDLSTSFRVGGASPHLITDGKNDNLTILDPFAKPKYSIYSVNYPNLKVKLYQVKAEDYQAFLALKKDDEKKLPNFGKLVFDKTISIKNSADKFVETRIDLNPALAGGFGHAVLIVETPAVRGNKENERTVIWLETTQIGVDAFSDYEKMVVFASDLKTGKPLGNVQVSLLNAATSGATDESGIASLPLPAASVGSSNLLIARRGNDSAILPDDTNYYYREPNWQHKPARDSLRWFVFNDRNLYRTGETVSIKGYLRKVNGGKFTDISEVADSAKNLSYLLKDSRGVEILRGKAEVNAFGAFDFKVQIPDQINLGYENLELTADSELEGKTFRHNFQVLEFRRPEFEVSAKVETNAPFYVGDSASVSAEAKYYSGGFLSNAETNWSVTAEPASYSPPNRDDFTFGKFIPWWGDYYESNYEERSSQQFKGVTDANGKHRIGLDFISANPSRPYAISAEAKIQDVNRQTFAATTHLLVHPSELYVGLKTPKTFVRAGEIFKVETIAADIDGKAVSNAPISIKAVLKDWQQVKGEWQEVDIETQNCETKSQAETSSCDFTAKQGGTYTITATVQDARNRRNESELRLWVAGGKTEPSRDVEQQEIQLIPDKKEYAPNEAAEILVNAPFFPAEGVLTLRRNGIIKTERFTMDSSSTVLRIPIEERYLPNIQVQVDLTGAAKRIFYEDERDAKLPNRPAFASGIINLKISTDTRKLQVTAEPLNSTLEPGGTTTVNVAVKDNTGKAAGNTEVTIVAVDESVLALTNYSISDPLRTFYPEIEEGVSDYHSRENVLLAHPEDVGIGYGNGSGMGNGDGDGSGSGNENAFIISGKDFELTYQAATTGDKAAKPTSEMYDENSPPIRMRKNFNALAIFAPSVKTDAEGKAVVKLTLPDNLTRYRITAVAATSSKQFGKSESNITAKQPLMVRPSAPRFMNFGDKIELPVVVQNQTDNPLTVDVAVRSVNALLTNGNGKRVAIPANNRAEIRFDVTTNKTGVAFFQIGATSGKLADAAEIFLPIYTPATTEVFATYGTTDQNGAIVQPIQPPGNVYSEFGGLEITTSSTQLQELTDAFIYLQNYPYECSEQISSRILSVAALRDVLTAFETKDLPSKQAIEAKMKSDIERLQKLQHADGGFSFWRSNDASLPFVSVHVGHALARAMQKGYPIPRVVLFKLGEYLKNIESKYPSYYSSEARRATSAYALYVRDLLVDKDAAKARRLLKDASPGEISPETLGWILSVLAGNKDSVEQIESIKRQLLNQVTETAGAAHFNAKYTDGEYVLLSSDRRSDAVILEALLKAEPDNDLIPKLVRGLLAAKTKGRWSNTQENVFVLLALDKYFQTYEKTTPNFVARLWLGNDYAGQQDFKGRSTDSNKVSVPMNYLEQQKDRPNLILDKQGEGRLYYRIGLNYAPKNLKLDAADYGFAVTRTYEAIDAAGDVKRNEDGSWTIKSGARVRVMLQMIAPTRRYHVALVDKLPAGFEIINPELATSEKTPDEDKPPAIPGYYGSIWFDHQNLRAERAEAFTSLLREGVWNYSYIARATTPGNFIVPPANAEEMYSPETFGRTGTDFVNIK